MAPKAISPVRVSWIVIWLTGSRHQLIMLSSSTTAGPSTRGACSQRIDRPSSERPLTSHKKMMRSWLAWRPGRTRKRGSFAGSKANLIDPGTRLLR